MNNTFTGKKKKKKKKKKRKERKEGKGGGRGGGEREKRKRRAYTPPRCLRINLRSATPNIEECCLRNPGTRNGTCYTHRKASEEVSDLKRLERHHEVNFQTAWCLRTLGVIPIARK